MKRLALTIEDFFQLKGAVLYEPVKISPVAKISIDSRNVSDGSLFIAIKGDKFDAHDFVADAVKNGASVVLINEKKFSSLQNIDVPIITVKDTIKAFGELGAIWRRKLKTKIIGITGSAGKTTTKEIIYTLLSGKFKVNKTLANHNNHIGVPLTLFSTNNSYDYLVLELGTNHFGEIEYTSRIAKPNYSLITNIGNSHLEFLKDEKGVYKEKSAMFTETIENRGMLFINNDDPFLAASNKKYSKRVTFGFNHKADVKGELTGYTIDGKPIIILKYKNRISSFELPLYGEQNAKNFLAASAIALKLGLSYEDIREKFNELQPVDKRLNVQRVKDFILINDTYNANPDSMKLALQLLSQISRFNKRIAVLGDMFELGKRSKALHEELADVIVKNKIDSVYLIGKMMKHLHKKLKSGKIEAIHFNDRDSLNTFLKNKSFSNSLVLVKGSRGMKMEEFVGTIQNNL